MMVSGWAVGVALGAPAPRRKADDGLEPEVFGYAELRGSAFVGVDGVPVLLVERFRPTLDLPFSQRVMATATVEVAASQGRRLQTELERTVSESALQPLFDAAGCVWASQPGGLIGAAAIRDHIQLDRAHLDVNLPALDLRVGRQAVRWGSGQVFNPTDPFPQVLLAEPWRPRRGINAVRAIVPVEEHEVHLLVGTDDRLTALRAAAKGTLHAGGTDLTAVGGYRGDDGTWIAGLDLKGTLGVGWWLEGVVHLSPASTARTPLPPREELIVGVDTSVRALDGIVLGAQYYRNGRGSRDAGTLEQSALAEQLEPPVCDAVDVTELFPDPADDPYRPFARGRDYVLLTGLARVVPEVELTLGVLQNLGDGTGLVVPTVRLVPLGWLTVSTSAQLPYRVWGDGGEFRPSAEDQRLTVDVLGTDVSADLRGLVPEGVFHLWTRATF